MNDEEMREKELPVPKEEEKPRISLKQVRETKGLSIRDLSATTRLSPSILTAIENEDFKGLPEPVYTKTFITTYAKALGEDPGGILSRYQEYLDGLRRKREAEAAAAPKPKKSSPATLIVLVILLLALASFYFYQRASGPTAPLERDISVEESAVTEGPLVAVTVEEREGITEKAPEVAEEEVPVAPEEESLEKTDLALEEVPPEQAATADAEEPAAAEERALPGPESATTESIEPPAKPLPPPAEASKPEFKSHRLEIEATEWTWLEITIDNQSPFEVMLKPGDIIERNASKKVMMIVGNASGVNITFDDKSLGPLGKHGEVILLTLPKSDE